MTQNAPAFSICAKSACVAQKTLRTESAARCALTRISVYVVLDSSPGLVEILRSSLQRLEEGAAAGPQDPAVQKFKKRILRSIAQLELQRTSLKAPDVIAPELETSHPAQAAQDSVVVLVAPRRRKPRNDAAGDHSSAA